MEREFQPNDENYAMLAAAIVEQACKDAMGYVTFSKKVRKPKTDRVIKRKYRDNKKDQMEEVRRFFCDEDSIFGLCMPHTDGEALLEKVYDNFEKYNNYMPPFEQENGEDGVW